MSLQTFNIIKVFSLTGLSFFVGLIWTPALTHFLYKYKLWKKQAQTEQWLAKFNVKKLEKETHTPRMGGLLVWITVAILSLFIGLWQRIWLPLSVLLVSSIVGLLDDFWSVGERREGLSFKSRAFTVLILGLLVGYLFYWQLNWPFFYVALVPLVM